MDGLRQDISYTFRTLVKSPGFTLIAVLSLALGIGLNTSLFSILNAVLLRPLPYRDPDRIVALLHSTPERLAAATSGHLDRGEPWWSYPKFQMLAAPNPVFELVAGYADIACTLSAGRDAERVQLELVSASYFPLLGLDPETGRVFSAEEDSKPGGQPVVVLSSDLARRRFGSAGAAVGKSIVLDSHPVTVIGVLAPGFKGQSGVISAWAPMMMAPVLMFPERLQNPFAQWHEIIAKLRPGISPEQATSQLSVLSAAIDKTFSAPGAEPLAIGVAPLRDVNVDPLIKTSLWVALIAVAFVLLIACVNVSNLLLSRAEGRRKEIATRLALGASRGRIARQLLTESLILGAAGGLLGLLLAAWGIDLLTIVKPSSSPVFRAKDMETLNFGAATIDSTVLIFNLAVSTLCGVLFGLVPSWKASSLNISERLKQRTREGDRRARFLSLNPRRVLVTAQIALSLTLLVGAGLMIRSLSNLQKTKTGFDLARLMTLQLQLPPDSDYAAFGQRLLAKIGSLPGVEAACVSADTPLSSNASGTIGSVPGRSRDNLEVGVHSVSSGYFSTLHIPLLRGRTFTSYDREGAPRVVIVNAAAARQFWPGQNPIGQRLHLDVGWASNDYAEVVGVAGDVKYGKLEDKIGPDVYTPHLQPAALTGFLIVRSSQDPLILVRSLRTAVRELAPGVPVYDIKTMEERAAEATSRTRFQAVLLGVFALLALVLAAGGIYGVMAHATSLREREIGIRIALGAKPTQVIALVLRDGLLVTAAGLVLGIGTSALSTEALSRELYQIAPRDPLTLVVVSLTLGLVALAACLLPALRASRMAPSVTLRSE